MSNVPFVAFLKLQFLVWLPRVTKVIIPFKQKNIWSERKFNAEIHQPKLNSNYQRELLKIRVAKSGKMLLIYEFVAVIVITLIYSIIRMNISLAIVFTIGFQNVVIFGKPTVKM